MNDQPIQLTRMTYHLTVEGVSFDPSQPLPKEPVRGAWILRGDGYFLECAQLLNLANYGFVSYAFVFIAAVRAIEGFTEEVRVNLHGMAPELSSLQDAATLLAEIPEKDAVVYKVQMLGLVLGGRPFPLGEQMMQDFKALVQIRNEMTHPKPARMDWNPVQKLPTPLKWMQSRGVIGDVIHGAEANIPQWVFNQRCGEWALSVAVAVKRAIFELIPQSQFRDSLQQQHQDLR